MDIIFHYQLNKVKLSQNYQCSYILASIKGSMNILTSIKASIIISTSINIHLNEFNGVQYMLNIAVFTSSLFANSIANGCKTKDFQNNLIQMNTRTIDRHKNWNILLFREVTKQGVPRTTTVFSLRVVLFEVSCKLISRKSLSLIKIKNWRSLFNTR